MKKSVGCGATGGNLPGTCGPTDATKTNPNPRSSKTLTSNDPPQPQNPTENWRETDKVFHQMVAEDKKNFASEKGVTITSCRWWSWRWYSRGRSCCRGGIRISPQSGPRWSCHHPQETFRLQPPPEFKPPDYSKYVQCPHCGRKFEEWAAVRHIPQCKGYDFNKDEKEQLKRSKSKSK